MTKAKWKVYETEHGWFAVLQQKFIDYGCGYHVVVYFNGQTAPNMAVYQHDEISTEFYAYGVRTGAWNEVPFSSIPLFQQRALLQEAI